MATNIDTWIQTIGEWLRDPDLRPEKKLEMIESSFERIEKAAEETFSDKSIEISKRFFINQAKESGRKLFRIIARTNSSKIGLGQWCNEARNFTMLIDNHEDVKTYKDGEYLKRTYTLDELPEALDNAWRWYKGVHSREVGNYNTMDIHVMAIDELKN